MDKLRIATWNLEDKKFRLNKNNIRMDIINEVLNEDVDALALQNADKKFITYLDEKLLNSNYHLERENPSMGIMCGMMNNDQNMLIIKNNYTNTGDRLTTDGLVISINQLKDKDDFSKNFYLLNANIDNVDDSYNILRELIYYVKTNKRVNEQMILAGHLNLNIDNIRRLNRNVLRPNSLTRRIYEKDEYLFFNEKNDTFGKKVFDVPTGMHNPMILSLKK